MKVKNCILSLFIIIPLSGCSFLNDVYPVNSTSVMNYSISEITKTESENGYKYEYDFHNSNYYTCVNNVNRLNFFPANESNIADDSLRFNKDWLLNDELIKPNETYHVVFESCLNIDLDGTISLDYVWGYELENIREDLTFNKLVRTKESFYDGSNRYHYDFKFSYNGKIKTPNSLIYTLEYEGKEVTLYNADFNNPHFESFEKLDINKINIKNVKVLDVTDSPDGLLISLLTIIFLTLSIATILFFSIPFPFIMRAKKRRAKARIGEQNEKK